MNERVCRVGRSWRQSSAVTSWRCLFCTYCQYQASPTMSTPLGTRWWLTIGMMSFLTHSYT